MEKYGCNRTSNIKLRIKELESINFKCAADREELRDLIKQLASNYDDGQADEDEDEDADADADERCCHVADLPELKKTGTLAVEDL